MINRISLEPAFILHRRPFSNSSLIVDLFSQNHGRLSALAKGSRRSNSRYRGKLELFTALQVSWTGRNELKTLGDVECTGAPIILEENALLCGFYINELLVKLLHPHDPHADLLMIYQQTLEQLSNNQNLEITLRCFEKGLLQHIGYGLSLTKELHSGKPIETENYYQYIAEQGFVLCQANQHESSIFLGKSLLALHHENFDTPQMLLDAKRLMRQVFNHHLGHKPLKSRELLK